MTSKELRSLLGVFRPGDGEADAARFAEAKKQAAADPELARWWSEEKEIDHAIGAKLAAAPIPAGLKARVTSRPIPLPIPQRSWRRPALLAAAMIVALAVLFGSWHGPFQPAASIADYRDEMVSFIKLAPSLELESNDLARITNFLGKSGAPSQFEIPAGLRKLDPVGCRTLRFHGHDVALVCFKRGGGRLAHLFVVDRAALANAKREYLAEGEWMTAIWTKGDQTYLLTTQGDQESLKQYLGDT